MTKAKDQIETEIKKTFLELSAENQKYLIRIAQTARYAEHMTKTKENLASEGNTYE